MCVDERPRIAVVELGLSHEEVLVPLVELLQKAYEVHVLAPSTLLEVDLVAKSGLNYTAHSMGRAHSKGRLWRVLGRVIRIWKLRAALREIRPRMLLFNTIHSVPELLVTAALHRGTPKVLVLHEARWLSGRFTRYVCRGFAKHIVLSENVYDHLAARGDGRGTLGCVLPIFFGALRRADMMAEPVESYGSDGGVQEVRLGVFGGMEARRKNVKSLIEALRSLKPEHRRRFRVVLMGAIPQGVAAMVEAAAIEDVVEWSRGYVSFEKLFETIRSVDVVCFLIDRSVANSERYNRFKISGTSSLAKAFRKCALASTDFPIDRTLARATVYYDRDEIGPALERIAERTPDVRRALREASALGDVAELKVDYQERNLRRLIDEVIGRPSGV